MGDGVYDIYTPYIKYGYPGEWKAGQQMICPFTDGNCVVDFKGSPDPAAPSNYKVVATDYDSYTIVYVCVQMYMFNYDIVWIMTRDPIPL